MAWLERDVRTGYYKVGFRVGNRKVKKSIQTSSRIEAKELLGVVEQTLRAVERGWVAVPPGVDLGEYLLSGGRLAGPLQLPDKLRLSYLFEAYFASLPVGNLAPRTICRLAGVSKETINRPSSETASPALRETLPQSDKPLQFLTTDDTIRSVHGVAYARLTRASKYAGDRAELDLKVGRLPTLAA